MIHAELIAQQNSAATEKSVTFPVDCGDTSSPASLVNLEIRRRMADELIERGLSKQAAARLLRLDPE